MMDFEAEARKLAQEYRRVEIKPRPTIEELEAILNEADPTPVTINPDGSISPCDDEKLIGLATAALRAAFVAGLEHAMGIANKRGTTGALSIAQEIRTTIREGKHE